MLRVGALPDDVEADYVRVGQLERAAVLERLPEGWDMAGSRLLDFGCGAGQALRHFGPEIARSAELWGCDIDGPSIEWARQHLPGVTVLQNGEAPPLDAPDGHFDLVYAISVFTHITDHWADWLIELRRVLRPEGLLIATVLGPTMYEALLGEPYDEDAVGMTTVGIGKPWDEGGPMVFHSPWWIERHWSPAFEILSHERSALGRDGDAKGHDVVVARRSASTPDRAAMLRPCDDEPREAAAALANVRLLGAELERLRREPPAGRL